MYILCLSKGLAAVRNAMDEGLLPNKRIAFIPAAGETYEKPYFGESAGAVILYHTIEPIKPLDEPEDAPELKGYKALGLINFIPLPHFDREKYKALFTKFLNDNKDKYPIVPFGDSQAILVRDDGYEIIPSAITP